MRKRLLILTLPVMVAVAAILVLTGAGRLLADTMATTAGQVPQEIAYTGRVVDGSGTPITGTRTVTFTIYDASSGGTLYWTEAKTVTLDNIGYFATRLGSSTPMMPSVFDGSTRYLQLQLNGTTFPRQKFSSVPYAFQSYYASYAMTATYAYTAGYATDAKYAMTATYALNSNGSNGSSSSYAYVKVVAKSGGDYTSISEAMAAITPTSSTRYLIKVMPGAYNERVIVKPYVHVYGSGINYTSVISSVTSGSFNDEAAAAMVVMTNAQVSNLTVNNPGSSDASVAVRISNGNENSILDHVRARAQGSGGDHHIGIYMGSGTSMMSNVLAETSGATNNWVAVTNASDPIIDSSMFIADGGTSAEGFHMIGGDIRLTNSEIYASNGSGSNIGVNATGSNNSARIDHSRVEALGNGNLALQTSNASDELYAGASMVHGGAGGAGDEKCPVSYDNNYDEIGTDCN